MLKLPDNLIRVAEARAPEVLLAPGGYFFSRLVPLPAEVTPAEYESLAELTLEECSPFPLDQLAWGYVVDDERRELWIYAACRPRIGNAVMDGWDEAEHVFPAFLPLLLAFPKPPERLLWRSDDEILLLDFANGSRFPTRIRHRRLPIVEEEGDKGITDDAAPSLTPDDVAEDFARAQGIAANAPIYELRETPVDDDRLVSFVIGERGKEEALPPLPLSEEASWRADLRSPEFIVDERRSRRWQNQLWMSLHWASWAAVALILLVLFNIIGDMLIKRRIALIAAQAPVVIAVEQNDNFLNDLRRSTQSPLRPFEVLGITNIYRDYKTTYYTAADVDNADGVTIQGVAPSVNKANAFNAQLLGTRYFKNLESPRFRSSGSEVRFTFRLDYLGPTQELGEPVAVNENLEVER